MAERPADVAVVGSGIVGLSCAFHLMRRGLRCVLVDPAGPGAETSSGNAGSISVGNVLPQATPGIAWRGLRMLFDPRAPLKLDLRHLPGYARWLLRFVRSGELASVVPIVDALHAINAASRDAWLELARDIGAESLVAPTGYLHVYSAASTFAAGAWERDLMAARGVRFEVLDRPALQGLEPGLGTGFEHGVLQPDALALLDPQAFCVRLQQALLQRGATEARTRVRRIEPQADAVVLHTDGGQLVAGRVVVAAGAWSVPLLAPLGIELPIVPARGYHLMYPSRAGVVRRPTLWAERYMVVAPMLGGIRMTSIKQLTALGSTPRYGLIRRRDADARTLFPALPATPSSEWSGLRPCTPDSLPILDQVAERIWFAGGHGHLGITQGPVSGLLIAQRMGGEAACLPEAPYRLARFGGARHAAGGTGHTAAAMDCPAMEPARVAARPA